MLLQVWVPRMGVSTPHCGACRHLPAGAWRERTAPPVTLASKSPPWNLLGSVPSPQCSRGQWEGARVGHCMGTEGLQNLPGLVGNRNKESGWGIPGIQASWEVLGESQPGQEDKDRSQIRRGLSEDGRLASSLGVTRVTCEVSWRAAVAAALSPGPFPR